jgi:hypothetical protein
MGDEHETGEDNRTPATTAPATKRVEIERSNPTLEPLPTPLSGTDDAVQDLPTLGA